MKKILGSLFLCTIALVLWLGISTSVALALPPYCNTVGLCDVTCLQDVSCTCPGDFPHSIIQRHRRRGGVRD